MPRPLPLLLLSSVPGTPGLESSLQERAKEAVTLLPDRTAPGQGITLCELSLALAHTLPAAWALGGWGGVFTSLDLGPCSVYITGD